jgi:LPS-assembly protein
VGRYNYSIEKENAANTAQRRGLIEALAGVEYDGGCWVARAVVQRYVTGADRRDNRIFFQIELNGIARVGTDPLSALKQSIPNYRMINQLTPLPAKFDNFR